MNSFKTKPIVINGLTLTLKQACAYFVGLFDAEGLLGVYFKSDRKSLTRDNLHWRLTVSQNKHANVYEDLSVMLENLGFPNTVPNMRISNNFGLATVKLS